jgi:anti-anti-sigma factor
VVDGEEVLVVHGRGELDLANRHEVRTAVAEAQRARRRRTPVATFPLAGLVVDLGAATYVGATTIAALAEEAGRTAARRTPRLVVGRGGIVGRVAAMLDLAEIFDVYDDLDDALAPGPRPT